MLLFFSFYEIMQNLNFMAAKDIKSRFQNNTNTWDLMCHTLIPIKSSAFIHSPVYLLFCKRVSDLTL